MPQCGKGWERRCAESPSRRCTCSCHGTNHGRDAKHIFYRGRIVPKRAQQAEFIDDLFAHEEGEDTEQ